MNPQSPESIQRELAELRSRIAQLEQEAEQRTSESAPDWRTSGYYWSYYATTGFFLGMIGAITSLLFNVVGAATAGLHPLQLIRVYLTFGMGAKALGPEVDTGLTLAIGCCLYIATGMLLGIPFQVLLSRYAAKGGLVTRIGWATLLSLAIWLFNYYGILTWLQPLMFGGNWIVEQIPVWVAAATHVVFGWTMAVVYPWGLYEPYRVRTER